MGLSIKGKLLLFALCISLMPIATITILYYFNTRNFIKQDELDDIAAIAESEKDHVIAFLEFKKARTSDFSTDGLIREKLETITYGRKYKAIENLNKHLSTNKKPLDTSILEIVVLDTDGRVVAATNEALIGLNMSGHEAFTQAIHKEVGECFTGQPRYSTEFNTDCIYISAPVITSNGNGEVVGVIINVYEPEMLDDIADIAEKKDAYRRLQL
ncbi:MAG: two-component sensor kinase [Candidatus Scalindua rubra]|uniref:Two-component sensor kinase n=1 Tax=Candidatus Scalindua rubra TaxID=1872076 RepID=A0A1E3X2F9_9BACT|nr:MAG: two-component sensor kinase [Candidatus Scalindua rubra]